MATHPSPLITSSADGLGGIAVLAGTRMPESSLIEFGHLRYHVLDESPSLSHTPDAMAVLERAEGALAIGSSLNVDILAPLRGAVVTPRSYVPLVWAVGVLRKEVTRSLLPVCRTKVAAIHRAFTFCSLPHRLPNKSRQSRPFRRSR